MRKPSVLLFTALLLLAPVSIFAAEEFPPGWLPVQRLDANIPWDDDEPPFTDKVQIHLPGDKPVRGVFVCFVFHSADPREVVDAWNFALVTITRDTIRHLGVRDRKTGKRTLGYQDQGMGLILKYLEHAAKATSHEELTTVPIVGWLGQAGGHYCKDLYQRAPQRVLAWADSFGGELRKYPELTREVPFAFAWEVHKQDLQSRTRRPPRRRHDKMTASTLTFWKHRVGLSNRWANLFCQMAKSPIQDDSLGLLEWDAVLDRLGTQIKLGSGQSYYLHIDVTDTSLSESLLQLARRIGQQQIPQNEEQYRRAVAEQFLECFNDNWNEGPRCSAETLARNLELESVTVSDFWPAEAAYLPTDETMFGGHFLLCCIHEDHTVSDVHLAG